MNYINSSISKIKTYQYYCSPIILNVFQLMLPFRKDFQRNLQDSMQMPDITKRNYRIILKLYLLTFIVMQLIVGITVQLVLNSC